MGSPWKMLLRAFIIPFVYARSSCLTQSMQIWNHRPFSFHEIEIRDAQGKYLTPLTANLEPAPFGYQKVAGSKYPGMDACFDRDDSTTCGTDLNSPTAIHHINVTIDPSTCSEGQQGIGCPGLSLLIKNDKVSMETKGNIIGSTVTLLDGRGDKCRSYEITFIEKSYVFDTKVPSKPRLCTKGQKSKHGRSGSHLCCAENCGMCGTHEISCQRPKGCCASEIFSSQKTCVASEEVNCVIPPRGYDELIHNPTTATEDKKQEPCMGFCTANPDSWDEKCSWGKTCSGCSQCKANQNQGPEIIHNPTTATEDKKQEPCMGFCTANRDSWDVKCSWDKTCSGCPQCKANQNQGPCLDFCALNPDSWREKCTWGATCKGCSQCNSI